MHEMFLKISYFKGGLSKNLEKVIFIFILKPAPFYRIIMKNKKDLELVTSNPSGCNIWSEFKVPL